MLVALFNEPVTVWVRNGTFDEINAAIEVLNNAEMFCGQGNLSYHCRAALPLRGGCVLIYEAIMAVIRADHTAARDMYAAVRDLMTCVPEQFASYAAVIGDSHTSKPSMFSPSEFDDMLRWTGAFHDNIGTDVTSWYMRGRYERMASLQSKKFLETGVWAPDFPIRRPSPAATVWGSDPARAERSCRENCDVHNAFSPGTFGAYCLCSHAKTVAVLF